MSRKVVNGSIYDAELFFDFSTIRVKPYILKHSDKQLDIDLTKAKPSVE